jgi:hypothetical protein
MIASIECKHRSVVLVQPHVGDAPAPRLARSVLICRHCGSFRRHGPVRGFYDWELGAPDALPDGAAYPEGAAFEVLGNLTLDER